MKQPLVEGTDYYLEDGKFVLMEGYHLRRGYCCNARCRHCPYGNAPGGAKPSQPPKKAETLVIVGLGQTIKLPR